MTTIEQSSTSSLEPIFMPVVDQVLIGEFGEKKKRVTKKRSATINTEGDGSSLLNGNENAESIEKSPVKPKKPKLSTENLDNKKKSRSRAKKGVVDNGNSAQISDVSTSEDGKVKVKAPKKEKIPGPPRKLVKKEVGEKKPRGPRASTKIRSKC